MVAQHPIPQDVLIDAIQWQIDPAQRKKPDSSAVAEALRQAERCGKRTHSAKTDEQLLGSWQLLLIAKSKRPSGQWIPPWTQIQITYTQDRLSGLESSPNSNLATAGGLHNQVKLGPLALTLSGPTSFHPGQGILAFDFTRIKIEINQRILYSGFIRGGKGQESQFYCLPLKQQAFFRFFWTAPQGIAARGKGGGLALWAKKCAG
ncbi:hypothetical protein [Altericista sp. CCNU0014]|uniref:hypothetical protein n=1 Tax=Altericista sp. CCNU0014 TaxID=3082949 RepID=UPI00384FF1A7